MQFIAVQLAEPPEHLLMLCWHSFSGGSGDIATTIFAHTSGQYLDYRLMLLHRYLSIQDERATIVDTLLMRILRRC